MKKRTLNILFFLLFFICLLLHFLFSPLHLIKDKPLEGYYPKPPETTFNLPDYFSRRYQDTTEKYINYQFGLFPGFTRVHHQLEYSWFNKINVQDVHIGKQGYLFRYVSGYFDDKTFPEGKLDLYIKRYSKFSDSLKAAGKNVIWVIAPDKNIVYSEFLADSVKHPALINGFYQSLKNAFKQNAITYLDFNELGIAEKNKYPFAVCNKGGVHWTQAYAARCFDSVCTYLSGTTAISIKNTISNKKNNTPWTPDVDIEAAANLLMPLEKNNNYFSTVESQSNVKNKKVLLIGDSFCHVWAWNSWMQQCFSSESEFWYYNREVHQLDDEYIKDRDHAATRSNISKFDTFIILFSAGNVEQLDYGFMEDVYK
ncbi:MAG: sugar O-acetyltransferase precursor [Bacteroidetes bacterium]|nr:sugar O-acetyltransferase precursor [Bacteroidota bacterium]